MQEPSSRPGSNSSPIQRLPPGTFRKPCSRGELVEARLLISIVEGAVGLQVRCDWCQRGDLDVAVRLWNLSEDENDALDELCFEIGPAGYDRDVRCRSRVALEIARSRTCATSLAAARRFPRPLRETVYWAVRHDTPGHVRQLLDQNPGVLALVARCEPLRSLRCRVENPLPSLPLWRDVWTGRRLDEVLDGCAARLDYPREHRRRLQWLARRSGTSCGPDVLLAVARLAEVPQSDLPFDPHERLLWLELLEAVAARFPAEQEDVRALRAAVVRYASAHHHELVPYDDEFLDRLCTYVLATGRAPQRGSPMSAIALRVDRLHEQLAQSEQATGRPVEFEWAEHAMPDPPFEGWRTESSSVEPVRTLRGLYREGTKMHHCIFRHWSAVMGGRAAVYHLEVRGRPSTLMLVRRARGWRVFEHSGPWSAAPSEAELEAAGRWLQAALRQSSQEDEA